MYASTFIFRAGQYDDEFHRLDRQIADMARARHPAISARKPGRTRKPG